VGERLAAQGDEVCRRGGDALLAAEESCSLVGGSGRRHGEEQDESGEGCYTCAHGVRHASSGWRERVGSDTAGSVPGAHAAEP